MKNRVRAKLDGRDDGEDDVTASSLESRRELTPVGRDVSPRVVADIHGAHAALACQQLAIGELRPVGEPPHRFRRHEPVHEHAEPGFDVRERALETVTIDREPLAGRRAKRQRSGKGGCLFDQRVAQRAVENSPSVAGPTRE